MSAIKELVGLLFWMDNDAMSTMKAVSSGQRNLSSQKRDILQYSQPRFISSKETDESTQPGAAPKAIEEEQPT